MPNVTINEIDSPRFTIGWELEACKIANETPSGVVRGSDGSVSGDGAEYRLDVDHVRDIEFGIKALKKLTSDRYLQTDKSCGFHVHVGYILTSNAEIEKRKLWAAWNVNLAREVEEQAFAVVPFTRSQNDYCQPWKRITLPKGIIKDVYSRDKYSNNRRMWVNHVEVFRPGGIGTIENRLMGDTKRFSQLYSWIAFCLLMAKGAYRLIEDPSLLPNEVRTLRDCLNTIDTDIKNQGPNTLKATKALGGMAELPWIPTAKSTTPNPTIAKNCDCPSCLAERRPLAPAQRIVPPTNNFSPIDDFDEIPEPTVQR